MVRDVFWSLLRLFIKLTTISSEEYFGLGGGGGGGGGGNLKYLGEKLPPCPSPVARTLHTIYSMHTESDIQQCRKNEDAIKKETVCGYST